MSKDCSVCVYNGVCEGRLSDMTIEDCCIPERPLRELQEKCGANIDRFISVTHKYITGCKKESKYWLTQLG